MTPDVAFPSILRKVSVVSSAGMPRRKSKRSTRSSMAHSQLDKCAMRSL